ncbi:hypothetical protein [Oceanobacillus sp. CAU 1775]
MAHIGMNDLMVAIQEMAKDLKEVKTDVAELKADVAVVKTDVAELKVSSKRLEQDHSDMREEWKLDFKKLKRKLTILSEEMLEARTDITLLEDKVF